MTVHLVADPGAPLRLAELVATDLADVLAREVSEHWTWQVTVRGLRLPGDDQGRVDLAAIADLLPDAEDGIVTVLLTDQPRRDGRQPIVGDVSTSARVALASVPALGARRVLPRARQAIAQLVCEIVTEPTDVDGRGGPARGGAGLVRYRRTAPRDEAVDIRYLGAGPHSRVRLLTGMIRANRPWGLVPQLSGAFAAAAAAVAFALVNPDIWRMADGMGALRLAGATLFALVAMVGWLIVDHHMWERPRTVGARGLAVLYNTTTGVTLLTGAVCMYVGLFLASVLGELVLLGDRQVHATLGHVVTWRDYAAVAWLAASMGTVAGALGTGLETDEAVRSAAYGFRQRERQSLFAPMGADGDIEPTVVPGLVDGREAPRDDRRGRPARDRPE